MYSSSFEAPFELARNVLYDGKIIDPTETPSDMVERVVATLQAEEIKYPMHNSNFGTELGTLMDQGKVVMSTPIMTNAGRHIDKPLSACTMPTVDLTASRHDIGAEIDILHQQGMGTGFNLSELENPVEMLRFLNDRAVAGSRSGNEERPVGNMAILHVSHPKIRQFIEAKLDAPSGEYPWKFNISVDADVDFMKAVENRDAYTLADGTRCDAGKMFEAICNGALQSADPGLIFMDRMNERNPVPGLGDYRTTAPCAEVGLIPGEACQFGYINVGEFIDVDSKRSVRIDYDGIYETSRTMTRALDNALDVSMQNFSSVQSRHVMSHKRKIGVGICGVADALSIAGQGYDTLEGRALILDLLNLINFASKEESVQLATERGSCLSMLNVIGNRYYSEPGHLERLYGDLDTTNLSTKDWVEMSRTIKRNGLLRNTSTVALPPTGRSALVIDASTGIEAHFTMQNVNPRVRRALMLHAGIQDEIVVEPEEHQEQSALILDATSIRALGHLLMAAELQKATDESISKTVNMPASSTCADVADVYMGAYHAGMSGITVYINGTFGELQPKALDIKK